MAELKDHDQPTLPSKRKPQDDVVDVSNKAPKITPTQQPDPLSNTTNNDNSEKAESDASLKEGSKNGEEIQNHQHEDDDDHEIENDVDDDEDEDEDDEDDDDDDGDEDDDEEEQEVVDRKGKGVMRDDKGKGKLIEGEEDDSDDDDDDDSVEGISGDESDFSDDPLAEVDLNNILPSRTRRRSAHPGGLHIADDKGNADVAGDDSDDSDA